MDYMPSLVFFIVGALFILLDLPLVYRRIPINIFYGFRVSKHVFVDKDIWYEVNELGGKLFFGMGIGLLILSGLALIASPEVLYYFLLPFEIGFLLTGILYTWYKTLILTYQLAKKKGHKK